MPTTVFDPVAHTYTVDGRIWPSVTQICSKWQTAVTGREPFAGCPTFYAERGTAVHSAIAMDLVGKLDWSSIDPQLTGFLEAYKKAKKDLRLPGENPRIEEILVGEGYCGTADLITGTALIDWKTGKHHWSHWMQLAAYRKRVPCKKRAGCIYLAEDGTYTVRWMSKEQYRQGWRWFWAAMDLIECQREHTRAG